jgi:hypothetical protein
MAPAPRGVADFGCNALTRAVGGTGERWHREHAVRGVGQERKSRGRAHWDAYFESCQCAGILAAPRRLPLNQAMELMRRGAIVKSRAETPLRFPHPLLSRLWHSGDAMGHASADEAALTANPVQ